MRHGELTDPPSSPRGSVRCDCGRETRDPVQCADCDSWMCTRCWWQHQVKRLPHAGTFISECEDRRISRDGP